MFHRNLNWIPRYSLVAKNFWLALSAHLCTRTLQPRRDVFRAHLLCSLVMTWKKILTDFFTLVMKFKEFKCGEDPRLWRHNLCSCGKKACQKRKIRFRLAGIRTPTSAIPMQCSNQHVLYCHWTVSNTSHILYILYSSNLQCTYSEHFQ